MTDAAEQVEQITPHAENGSAGTRTSRRNRQRKAGLAVLLLLVPMALVIWQWSLTVAVASAGHRAEHPTGPTARIPDLIASRSQVLDQFFRSDDFDAYAAWYVKHQTAEDKTEDQSECANARRRVFLPILSGRVDRACTALLGASTTSRSVAFAPILIEFFHTCRDKTLLTKTHRRPASPYTSQQWRTLDPLITQAVKDGCARPITA